MDINHKNIVLTGASSGIGKEILKELSNYKCRIIAVDKDENPLSKSKEGLGRSAKIEFIKLNIGNKKGVDSLFNYSNKKFGKVDIFIANAGFAYYEKIKKSDWNHIEEIYKTNVFSPIYSLEKLNEQKKKFLFVIISSSIGFLGIPGYSLYSSTKASLNRFFETYKYESENNKILEVYPIGTRTDIFRRAGKNVPIPLILQEPDYVAKKIIRSISFDRKKLFPSKLFRFLFVLNRVFPFILKMYQRIESKRFKKWQIENK